MPKPMREGAWLPTLVGGLLLLTSAVGPLRSQSAGPDPSLPMGRTARLGDPISLPDQAPDDRSDSTSPPPAAGSLREDQVERIVERLLDRRDASGLPAKAAKPTTKDREFEVGKQRDFRASWENGVRLQTEDGAFRFHVGGLLHAEAGWWNAGDEIMNGPDGVGPLQDGARFRRVRLHIVGKMYETVDWTIEVGFENGLPQFYNVFAEWPELPWIGSVRVGHFREPFGLDALTSYNNLTFLERALVQDALVPFFNMGVMVHGELFDQHATYAAGVFRATSDNFDAADAGDGTYAYTSRLTALPCYEADSLAVHLGAAFSHRVTPRLDAAGLPASSGGAHRVQYNSRPEFRVNAPQFLRTGVIQADHDQRLGAEFGLSRGPLLIQAEYMAVLLNDALAPQSPTRADYLLHGYYVQASYFLTGEHRPYVRDEAIFGAVRPRENFFAVRSGEDRRGPVLYGLGAWELALRYSHVDLDDRDLRGGALRDLTCGLNWYLNPHCRVLWNYILMWRDAPQTGSDGFAQAFGARFQLEF